MPRKKRSEKERLITALNKYGVRVEETQSKEISNFPIALDNLILQLEKLKKQSGGANPNVHVETRGYYGGAILRVNFPNPIPVEKLRGMLAKAKEKEKLEKEKKRKALENKMKKYEDKFQGKRPF